jgi:hypothetical protein
MKPYIENGVTFAYLGMDDFDKLAAALKAQSVAEINAQLEAIKPPLPPAQRFQLFREQRPDRVTASEMWAYVKTADGARAALNQSLLVAGTPSPDKVIAEYDISNAGNLAAHLLGFEHREFIVAEVKATDHPTQAEPAK